MGEEPIEPQEMNWEEIRKQYLEVIREYAIAFGGLENIESMITSDSTNNFHQHFPKSENGKDRLIDYTYGVVNGFRKKISDEENETVLLKDRLKTSRFTPKQALEPKDFNKKYSEKFLNTTVNEFYRDIDEALALAGLTEDDMADKKFTKMAPDIRKEKTDLANKAFQYLIVKKGYNWYDLGS